MLILDRTKSVLTTYVLPAIAVIVLQFVIFSMYLAAQVACGSIGTGVCGIIHSSAFALFVLAPLVPLLLGAYLVFRISKNKKKALIFLLVFIALDVLVFLNWITGFPFRN